MYTAAQHSLRKTLAWAKEELSTVGAAKHQDLCKSSPRFVHKLVQELTMSLANHGCAMEYHPMVMVTACRQKH